MGNRPRPTGTRGLTDVVSFHLDRPGTGTGSSGVGAVIGANALARPTGR